MSKVYFNTKKMKTLKNNETQQCGLAAQHWMSLSPLRFNEYLMMAN